MMKKATCPECGAGNLYASDDISAGGGYAPNYLPGLGSFLSAAKFSLVLCKDCGLTRFFASPNALEKLADGGQWHKL